MSSIQDRLQNKPYEDYSYATRPSKLTMFWRKCLIKQVYKFFALNLMIMRIVVGGHS
jgi:hypothetical protein